MSDPILYIGNKNYSSWSMRPWLALRWAGVPFEERVIPLGGDGYGAARIPAILAVSPTGKVPALAVGGQVITDSLAISEWAAEQPGAALLPADPLRRALVRAAVAEMHAGFAALRRSLAMNIRRRLDVPPDLPADAEADLARLFDLWGGLRAAHAGEGPWLFGARSLADAFYAPVATRLQTYAIPAPPACAAYVATALADPDAAAWCAAAATEPFDIPSTDTLYLKGLP